MTERTILDLYRHEHDAPRPEHYLHVTPEGTRSLSTEEFFARTAALAEALAELGVKRGDRVMLLSDNRPEWHMVDLAVADLGAVTVPVYGTLTPSQIAYQANDSGATVAVADGPEQLAKFLEVREQCDKIAHLVQIEDKPPEGALSFGDLISSAASGSAGDRFWERAGQVEEDDLLTLIYTSGTTGEPKGVMLTHANLVQNVVVSAPRAPIGRSDLALEFLPLCHVLERMVGYIIMYRACSKAYCSVYHVGDLLPVVKPTMFTGVPRFYEKVYDKVMEKVSGASSLRRALFDWALEVGKQASRYRHTGETPPGMLRLKHSLAERLVLSKVRGGLGGRVRYSISGGAPLALFVNEFFHALGVHVLEGYGLTETSPVIAVNGAAPGTIRLGTVGKPLPNLEVKLGADGELLVRGPSVMKGYWNKPDKTAEVFDAEGFFHTGDIAEIDPDGFVKITDRKKDLIVTAGGKNVAPQPIEGELKRSQYVDNAILVGDRRPYIVALFSPNTEELERWAQAHDIEYASVAELTRDPRARKLFADAVEEVNGGLARYEQIKKFEVLPLMLSIEGGHLTPTLKVKRRVVEREYSDLIAGMYEE